MKITFRCHRILGVFFLMVFALGSCRQVEKPKTAVLPFDDAPAWASSAIWYQIFVERFYNGNPENDPIPQTMQGALMDEIPADWSVTPWTHDWYVQEEWAKKTGLDFYRTIQMRRYGGDLEGVMQKIGYLKDLGINAIYFNPLNDAPSLHKYDARNYHHIDVTFGDDRDGDRALIRKEDPSNPETWVWTNADKKFIALIDALHKEGIKVVLDFSWNHTGTQFWAFQDIVKNGASSRFASWYEIKSFDDPATSKNEWDYDGWLGIKSLPEFRKIKSTEKIMGEPFEGDMPEDVKAHIFAVCRRWMDPNADGNPEDGIDGMRLDVAEHVPVGFWRAFRKFTRDINPEFYLIGENWWAEWPDKLMDAEPWVKGDIFDAVMHYQWYKPVRSYINQGDDKIDLPLLYRSLDSIYAKYKPGTQDAMMNLVSSHDAERVLSALYNSNKYKYQSKPQENPYYKTGRPDTLARQKLLVLLLHQFTFKGAPHIWNGDEMGMWGADDPDNRKPLWWKETDMETETPFKVEKSRSGDKPYFDQSIFDYYASLCRLRNTNPALQKGSYHFLKELLPEGIMAYERELEGKKITVLLNATGNQQKLSAGLLEKNKLLFTLRADIKKEEITFKPYSGIVILKD